MELTMLGTGSALVTELLQHLLCITGRSASILW